MHRPPATVAFSPSRSSFGSGYSMQSGPGEEETAAGGASGSGSGRGGDPGVPGGSGGQFPRGGFAGITDEELAVMDPKRAKRLIANRQARASIKVFIMHLHVHACV